MPSQWKYRIGWLIILPILFPMLFLSACVNWSEPREYEGRLLEIRTLAAGEQTLVKEEDIHLRLDFNFKEQTALGVVRKSSDQSILRKFEATHMTRSGFIMSVPGLDAGSLRFKRYKPHGLGGDQRCFEASGDYDYLLCATVEDFSLVGFKKGDRGLPVFSLSGWLRKQKNLSMVEAAQNPSSHPSRILKLSEIFDLVAKRNVTSKVEFQRLMQVKYLMQATYLNLLPHLHVGGAISAYGQAVLSIMGGPVSPGALLGVSNDFTPFIFPTRWINAYRSKLFYRAQKDTFRIIGADLTFATETLVYEMAQLQEGYKIANQLILRLKALEDEILDLEKKGKANPGTHDAVSNLRRIAIIQRENAHAVAIRNKAALSEMLGFTDPNAFDGVLLDPDLYRIEDGKPLSPSELVKDFLQRSIEMRQIDYFRRASKLELAGLFLQWIDPQGNGAAGLGLNLIPQYHSGRAQLSELDLKRDQLSLKLIQEGSSLVERANLILEQFHRAEELFNHQVARVTKIEWSVQNAFSAGSIGMVQWRSNEIENMFLQFVEARLMMETYRTQYRILRAQIDRLLLNGQYAKFSLPPFMLKH